MTEPMTDKRLEELRATRDTIRSHRGMTGLESDFVDAIDDNDRLRAEVEALRENDVMRGIIANSDMDCVYCSLPKAEMSRCRSGFPGCGRMDDIVLAPDFEGPTS